MRYNQHVKPRRSLRLRGFDYSQAGGYFITLCAFHRENLFGEIEEKRMVLNDFGKMVEKCWFDLPQHYQGIELDYHVVMSNHFHGILFLRSACGSPIVRAGCKPAPTKVVSGAEESFPVRYGLSEIVRGFKTFSSRCINADRRSPGHPVWQRGFHDRIIRNDYELKLMRQYIQDNPHNWNTDTEIASVGAGL